MTEFYVVWRADVKEMGAGANGRFQRSIDELDAYPKIVAPTYVFRDPTTISFGFAVEGFGSQATVRQWAKRALVQSLHHARIGTPDLPDSPSATVRLSLHEQPILRQVDPIETTRDPR